MQLLHQYCPVAAVLLAVLVPITEPIGWVRPCVFVHELQDIPLWSLTVHSNQWRARFSPKNQLANVD